MDWRCEFSQSWIYIKNKLLLCSLDLEAIQLIKRNRQLKGKLLEEKKDDLKVAI